MKQGSEIHTSKDIKESGRVSLTYEKRILVEEIDKEVNNVQSPGLIKFPKPSSMNVVTVVKKRTSMNLQGLTLGSIDPNQNQWRNKPSNDWQGQPTEPSVATSSNGGAMLDNPSFHSNRQIKTTGGGYRMAKRDLKDLLKKSSMRITQTADERTLTSG